MLPVVTPKKEPLLLPSCSKDLVRLETVLLDGLAAHIGVESDLELKARITIFGQTWGELRELFPSVHILSDLIVAAYTQQKQA